MRSKISLGVSLKSLFGLKKDMAITGLMGLPAHGSDTEEKGDQRTQDIVS